MENQRMNSVTSIGYTEDEVAIYDAIAQKLPEHIENISLNINTDVVNLLTLNDYCLEIIFQHLDLHHQIRLSLCHSRLQQVFADMICPRLPRHLDLQSICNFSRWELQEYFHTFGIYLESVLVDTKLSSDNAASIFSSIEECNLPIKRVHFILNQNLYRSFFNVLNYDYIIELELYNCGLKDCDLESLRKLRNLEILGLAYNHDIQGSPLKYLRKLQCLSLYGCRNITSEALNKCYRNMQLRYLDIRSATSGFTVNYCETLETLKVSNIYGSEAKRILKLPNLKSLEVHNLGMEDSQFWRYLAKNRKVLLELKLYDRIHVNQLARNTISRLRKLRTLWLRGSQLTVTENFLKLISNLTDLEEIGLLGAKTMRDEDLLALITNCNKLKRLNLRGCLHITNNSIFSVLNILQNRAAVTKEEKRESQPLVILAHGTGIGRDILQDPVYKERQHLLKLIFHNEIPLMGLTNERSAFDIKDTRDCNGYELYQKS